MSKKRNLCYTVLARRYGDSTHVGAYLVGVFDKKAGAIKAADDEVEFRGGKYSCEVVQMPKNEKFLYKNQKIVYKAKSVFCD